MERQKVFSLFEELMIRKWEQDEHDLLYGVQPRLFALHLIDHKLHLYKTNDLANRVLASVVKTLNQLYKENHQYGILFNRMMAIHHPEPIDKVLCTFLIKINKFFNKILDNYSRKRKIAL